MMKLVVLSCLMAAASASVLTGVLSPIGLSASLLAPSNYRGPLSLAPGQPANVLALDGRPLDTLDVNLDRSAHFTAKALEGGIRLLKKRSATLLAPVSRIAVAGAPLIASSAIATPIAAAPIAPIAPITYAAAPVAHAW